MVLEVGVDLFGDAMKVQALYHLNRVDWRVWMDKILEFCETAETKVCAESALNELNGAASILSLDVKDHLCSEIDNSEDLAGVNERLGMLETK